MINVNCLNNIAACGLKLFSDEYNTESSFEDAQAVLVRSAKMHDMELSDNLLAIARAGAGVNNIPLDKCAEEGIVVFNTPGANANAVKEQVIAAMLLASRDLIGGNKWVADNAEDPDIAKATEKAKKAFAGQEIKGKKLGVIGLGEAAFYGPKLDVNVKPAIGNEYTLSTCQLDFCLPSKFNLTYIDKDGQRKTPVVLHRAILGSLDRFMAYILEETKGNLPLWLAPVQATILPVKNEDEELNAYAHGLYDYLADNGIRVEIDERAEKLGYRVREAQVKKIPYLIVLGKNEAAEGTVSYRLHGEQKSTTVSKDEFVAMLKDEIATKKNNPAAAK